MAPLSRRGKAQAGQVDGRELATRVLNETRRGLEEHQLRTRRFDNAYEVYRGATGATPSKDTRSWQSKLRVKYGMLIVNENVVSIIQGIPGARCNPRRPEDVNAAKAMEHILGYYTDQDHTAEKQFEVALQAVVYGVSPFKNHWLYREANRQMLVPAVDQATGQQLWTPGNVRIVECDRPCFEPWDAYDCWWDPGARDVDTAGYIVLRSWLSKEELEAGRYDEDTGQGAYRNLDELYRMGQGQQPPSSAQNRLVNTDARYKDRFEIWEVWRDDRLTVLGNRQVVLRDGAKPYWMEGKPLGIASARPDPFRVEGISETELVDHLQQAQWTWENLIMDQAKMTVLRGATVRETVPDMKQLVFRPSFLWPVTDHDDVKFQDPPPLPSEAFAMSQSLLDRLQLVTGISGYVTGNVAATAGRSATGVSILSKAAHAPLEFKAEQLRLHVWQRTYEQWAALTKQFLTTEQSFKINGPDGPAWQKFGPADVFGDYDVKIEASEESLNRDQERADAVALLNALAPFAQFGLIDPAPLLERVAEAYGFPQPDALVKQQPQLPSAAPVLPPPGQGAMPLQPPAHDTLQNGAIMPQPPLAVLRGNR